MIFYSFAKPFLLCVSPPIGQTLAGDTFERDGSTLFIRHTELDAVVVSEIEFGDITLKMLLSNMVICPDQATLKKREEAFDRVGMHDAAHVLKCLVVDGVVTGELPTEFGIDAAFVSHQVCVALNLAHQD